MSAPAAAGAVAGCGSPVRHRAIVVQANRASGHLDRSDTRRDIAGSTRVVTGTDRQAEDLLVQSGGALDSRAGPVRLPPAPGPVAGVAGWTDLDEPAALGGSVALANSCTSRPSTLAVQLRHVGSRQEPTPTRSATVSVAALKRRPPSDLGLRDPVPNGSRITTSRADVIASTAAAGTRTRYSPRYGTPKSGVLRVRRRRPGLPVRECIASICRSRPGLMRSRPGPSAAGHWVVDRAGNVSAFGVAAADHGGHPGVAGREPSARSRGRSGTDTGSFTTRGRAFRTATRTSTATCRARSERTDHRVGSDADRPPDTAWSVPTGEVSGAARRSAGRRATSTANRPVVGISPTPTTAVTGRFVPTAGSGAFGAHSAVRGWFRRAGRSTGRQPTATAI